MDPKELNKSANGPQPQGPGPSGDASRTAAARGAQLDGEVGEALTFPVLVEPITPAGTGGLMTTSPGGGYAPRSDLGAQVTNALRDVLGWQPRGKDAKGFLGALAQSFDLREVEGHVEATWRERRFAVQSDLSGGISGAQASLLRRARKAVEDALPILDGLYSLKVDADPEDVAAVRSIVASELNELVGELAILGGPRVSRVNQIFDILLGLEAVVNPDEADPDKIEGTLGKLRDLLGLTSDGVLVNTVEEEQNLTNFRVLADYAIGLRLSWIDNRPSFSRSSNGTNGTPSFFGTQLVLLSRQLAVVSESVGELRTVLDSVFIGALERQTLEIEKNNPDGVPEEPPFFLEELLGWIEAFATREGPQLIQSGGKLGVQEAFLPTAERLLALVKVAESPTNEVEIPEGYRTQRVKRALKELELHLQALVDLAKPIQRPSNSGQKALPRSR